MKRRQNNMNEEERVEFGDGIQGQPGPEYLFNKRKGEGRMKPRSGEGAIVQQLHGRWLGRTRAAFPETLEVSASSSTSGSPALAVEPPAVEPLALEASLEISSQWVSHPRWSLSTIWH